MITDGCVLLFDAASMDVADAMTATTTPTSTRFMRTPCKAATIARTVRWSVRATGVPTEIRHRLHGGARRFGGRCSALKHWAGNLTLKIGLEITDSYGWIWSRVRGGVAT